MYKLQIVEHFPEDDKECGGDYWYVTVEIDGNEVIEYGDYYHEKGRDRAEGWVQGFIYANDLLPDEIEILELKQINNAG